MAELEKKRNGEYSVCVYVQSINNVGNQRKEHK